jgi:hypothetical protein
MLHVDDSCPKQLSRHVLDRLTCALTGCRRKIHERRSLRSADLQLHVRSVTSPVAERADGEPIVGSGLLGVR